GVTGVQACALPIFRAKAAAEAIVRDAGIPWTIFRPSAFEGEGHKPPAVLGGVTRLLRLDRWRPIGVEALAAAILRSALARAPLAAVLEGRALWGWGDQSTEASTWTSTIIHSSSRRVPSTMVAAGRTRPTASPCARPTACQSRAMSVRYMRVRTTWSSDAPTCASAVAMLAKI